MVTVGNSSPGNRPARRLRFDAYPAVRAGVARPVTAGHSGQRFVITWVLAVLILAGGLALAFRDWRIRYQVRAAFGAGQVATVIDPLAEVVPPEFPRDSWRHAVAQTHAMLVALTASNMLDLSDMRALRADLRARVARARPETARAELAAVWDELARRGGPNLVQRHPRPDVLSGSPVPSPRDRRPLSPGPDRL
jgi:hypothetical protein